MNFLKRYSAALWAGPRALGLIARDSVCRSLVIMPWIWGVVVYITLIVAAFWAYGPLQNLVIGEDSHNALVSIALAVGLFIVVSLSALGFVFVLSAVWSIQLIRRVLELSTRSSSVVPPQARGFVSDAFRTTLIESLKLLLLSPLYLVSFVLVLFPPLLPFGILLGAWLIGVTFVDTVLDTAGARVSKRLVLPLEYALTLTLFGIPFALVSLLPFVVIFLPPIISVAAALVVTDGHFLLRSAEPSAAQC